MVILLASQCNLLTFKNLEVDYRFKFGRIYVSAKLP